MTASNYSWRVEAVVPKELKDGRVGRLNLNLQVIAPSLEAAMAAVKCEHPQIDFIKVMRDRSIDQVIVATMLDNALLVHCPQDVDDTVCAVCGADEFAADKESYTVVRWNPATQSNELVAVYCPEHREGKEG